MSVLRASNIRSVVRASRKNTRCLSSTSPLPPALPPSLQELRNEPPDTLIHARLSAAPLSSLPSYTAVESLQHQIRQLFLSHKAALSSSATSASASASSAHSPPKPPPPVVLTFTPTPTYTLGRRQSKLDPSSESQLRGPLHVTPPTSDSPPTTFSPSVLQTDRGGLTTYHGPGQLVFWPVLDIHSPHHAQHTVRSYARLLEDTTRTVLASVGIDTYLSEADPGVWVGAERKIAALGVHLRRHITSLGLALNVDVPVTGPEDVNPWSRFVPCGLEGKAVTSVRQELGGSWEPAAHQHRDEQRDEQREQRRQEAGAGMPYRDHIAALWVQELARRLGIRSVKTVHVHSAELEALSGQWP